MRAGLTTPSFELYVHFVDHVAVPCLSPAVGFRLLDFPSLIIYQNSKRDALPEEEQNSVGRNGHVFNKGKSSLFNMGFSKLYNLLSSIPVYIMLLDVGQERSKLLGSCSISLKSAVEEMQRNPLNNVPMITKKTASLHIFDLMGTVIGRFKVSYTLYSYGNSLNKHMKKPILRQLDLFYDEQSEQAKQSQNNREGISDSEIKSEKLARKITNMENEKALFYVPQQPLALESSAKEKTNCKKVTEESSTFLPAGSVKPTRHASRYQEIPNIYDMGNGTFCPPPLFYRSVKDSGNPTNKWQETLTAEKQIYASEKKPQVTGFSIDEFANSATNYPQEIYDTEIQATDSGIYHEIIAPKECREGNAYKDHQVKMLQKPSKDVENVREVSPVRLEQKQHDYGLSEIISSLNELPLLQGILKEIINFSKKQSGQATEIQAVPIKSKGEENIKEDIIISKPKDLKSEALINKQKSMSKDTSEATGNKLRNNKGTSRVGTAKNRANKLKFRTTRTHQMRCAMTSANKGQQNQLVADETGQILEGKTVSKSLARRYNKDGATLNAKRGEKEVFNNQLNL